MNTLILQIMSVMNPAAAAAYLCAANVARKYVG